MKRIFLDANVLFTAAHNPNGKAAFVIELAGEGNFTLFTSSYAREEAEKNISLKYPGSLPVFARLLRGITIVPASSRSTDYPGILPGKDAPVFTAAVYCRATHLLTGDIKHFGPLMNKPELCGGVIVQTVADFLNSLLTQ